MEQLVARIHKSITSGPLRPLSSSLIRTLERTGLLTSVSKGGCVCYCDALAEFATHDRVLDVP